MLYVLGCAPFPIGHFQKAGISARLCCFALSLSSLSFPSAGNAQVVATLIVPAARRRSRT